MRLSSNIPMVNDSFVLQLAFRVAISTFDFNANRLPGEGLKSSVDEKVCKLSKHATYSVIACSNPRYS